MKMRSAVTGVMAALCMSLMTAPSADASDAGGGEWDYLGHFIFVPHSNGLNVTEIVESGGGNFKICPIVSESFAFRLYEYDPDNPDDLVGTVNLGNQQCHVFDVSSYVDGTNGHAELFLASSSLQASVEFWD